MKTCADCFYFTRLEEGLLDPGGQPMSGCGMDMTIITQTDPATGEVLATSEVLATDEACQHFEPA